MREPYNLYDKPIIMPDGAEYYIDDCPPIGAGGYALLYSAHTKDSENKSRFVIKEFFPFKGAKRNEAGQVVPVSDSDATLFNKKLDQFNNEGILGATASNDNCQVIPHLSNGNGYAVMKHISADTRTIMELVQQWVSNPPKTTVSKYQDLGRVKYSLLIIRSLLSLLKALHHRNILHLDISPGNVFEGGHETDTGEGNMAFLGDFGCSVEADANNQYVFMKGTSHYNPGFSAPELHGKINGDLIVSNRADLFSCAVLLFFLCLGDKVTNLPLSNPNWRMDSYDTIFDYEAYIRRRIEKLSIPDDLKEGLSDLIICGCKKAPEERFADASIMQQEVQKLLDQIGLDLSKDKIFGGIRTYSEKPLSLEKGTYVPRKKELDRLDKILHQDDTTKRYCIIQGVGGTGKSELARAYAWFNKDRYKRVFFLTYPEKAKKDAEEEYDLIDLLKKSNYRMDDDRFTDREAEELFFNLEHTDLLIVDNCQTVSNNLLRFITEHTGNSDVILTTRGGIQHNTDGVKKTLLIESNDQEEFALAVFSNNYCWNNEKEISSEEISVAADICKLAMYNPLLLSMLAIQCREYELDLTDLKERMSLSLANAELNGAEIQYEKEKNTPIEGSISTLIKKYFFFDILQHKFDSYQKAVLTVLCMVPAEQISANFLCEILGDIPKICVRTKTACDKLVRLNWIQKTEDFVSIHPLLAEVLSSFGETQLISSEEIKEFCNHTLQNWLTMNETTQKEELFLPYVLWEHVKEEDQYVATNLFMSVVLDKTSTLVSSFWGMTQEAKQHANVVFYVSRYKCGSVYGVYDLETEQTNVCLDLKSGRRRYWEESYYIDTKNDIEGYAVLLYVYLTTELHLNLPNEINEQKVVKIEDGFARNNELIRSVDFPAYVKEMGAFAFYKCHQLSGTLSLPENITVISQYCFALCTSLCGVALFPKNLIRIEEGAFSHCYRFRYLGEDQKLPNSVEYLGPKCFECCEIERIVISENVKVINEESFAGCTLLKSVLFPKRLEEIKDSAFCYCDLRLRFPEECNLKKIGAKAFERGAGGVSLQLPESLEYIGHHAFADCTFRDGVSFHDALTYIGNEAFSGCTYMYGSINFGKNLREIGERAFYRCGCSGVLRIPDNILKIGKMAFAHCPNLLSVEVSSIENFVGIKGQNNSLEENINSTSYLLIRGWCNDIFKGCSLLTSFLLSGIGIDAHDVMNASDIAYAKALAYMQEKKWPPIYEADELQKLSTMSNSIAKTQKIIKEYNYSYSDMVKIIEQKICIDDYEYYNLKKLKGDIDLSKVQNIGAFAFRGCSGLRGSLNLESVVEIGDHAFSGCKGFKGNLNLGPNLKIIKTRSFYNCRFSGGLKLPNRLVEIGVEAFAGCKNITSLEISPNVEKIKFGAFLNCENLKGQLIVPASVDCIEYNAFAGTNYTRIVLYNDHINLAPYITGYYRSSDVTIVARRNSEGFKYAKAYNYMFEPLLTKKGGE